MIFHSTSDSAAESPTSGKDVEFAVTTAQDSDSVSSVGQGDSKRVPVSLTWKLTSILLVSAIGFGSQWRSGITGATKSTLKKELKIDNTQFALIEASGDFMITALILISGFVTDRIGGAGCYHKPNQFSI